jgi:hypothetical protein
VQEVSSSSASVLSQAFGTFSTISSPEVSSVLQAFGDAIAAMGVTCADIGAPSGYTLCTSPEGSGSDSDIRETPTSLAGDLYVTTTFVQDWADIALDIKDITEALREGNSQLAQLVYSDGKNSQQFDENGKFVKLRSLKGFSTERTGEMIDEPEFNMYLYALEGNRMYADDIVEQSLLSNNQANFDVAVEAALILNLWMEIVHLLHESVQACKNNNLQNEVGVHSMDIAVAYWIGDGQIAGDSTNGHLLYALAERLGEKFGIDDGGQSRTNTNILRLFNEAKNEVSLPNACSESRTTYIRLRRIVNQIIRQMAIPLVQGLISSMRSNDRARVNIYSNAFVPLVAGCSQSVFDSLKQKLLPVAYNVVDVEAIIDLVRQSYPCLGLQCADIGIHEAELSAEVPACVDPEVLSPLAVYRPASDVREVNIGLAQVVCCDQCDSNRIFLSTVFQTRFGFSRNGCPPRQKPV